MERLLKEERLPSMKLALSLTTAEEEIEEEGEIEEEREIDEEGDIDAAEGVTNKAIRLY
jgi:hypothetical protein